MIQIYTGEGKGKTTAAIGLAVRASKHFKVLVLQFIKDGKSSEVSTLQKVPNITYKAFGNGKRVYPKNKNESVRKDIEKGISYLCKNYAKFQVIIMDEAITAVTLGLLPEEELLCLTEGIKKDSEIILTGRGASKKLIKKADLVTEMKKVKHYYDAGVKARKGIEL